MDLGLTQQTLARKLGCTYESVAGWEKGASVPLSRRWPAIQRLLGEGLVPNLDGLPGRVRTARLLLGLTQDELARLAGLDVRTLRNTERGSHAPSPATASRLRRLLGDVL